MNAYNTTYNFNQPNMNFGQALLYGAFGSLTGGMGCFGGGYGMGMGGFGMGGSLFSMPGIGGYGFGGFGMGCYSDQMIGMQVGTSIMQYAMFGISRAIEGRGAAKAQRQQAMNDASDNVSSIKSEINELEKNNTTEKIEKDLNPKFDKNIEDAESSKATLVQNKDKITKDLSSLNTQYENMPESTQEEKDAKAKFKKEKIDPKQAELDKLNADKDTKGSIAEAEEKIQIAKQAKQDEINKIKKQNDQKIKDKEAELKEANQELEEIASEQVKISKKCDTDEEYNNIVGTKGNLNNCDSKNVKDFVKAFNYKFSQYCKASSKSDKQKLAKSAIEVYDKIYNCSAKYITADMKRNMNIMKSYTDNDGNQYGV